MLEAHGPRRVAALHDLSCFGRCALTVILPTLSVMGYQVVPIPTALLSTHTGGFTDLHFRDLTADMERIASHFDTLGVTFDAIYPGFLGSAEQIETVCQFIDRFGRERNGESPLVLVDPVMGDDGALYSTYTSDLVQGVKHLAQRAQVLTPNLTEACFLTDTPYRPTESMDPEEARAFAEMLLGRLSRICKGRIVITGITLSDGMLANLGQNEDGSRFYQRTPIEAHSYPGTGDLFASVLLGELLGGSRFEDACRRAADFTAETIRVSAQISTPAREGVALEWQLHRLVRPGGGE
ncbi:MAG: pyridoxamine kinase [Clostridia bacterium]|nr:pyridoxamine kinase [Clostridia bacterium]